MIIVGVDPGKRGGIAVLTEKKELLEYDIMRDLACLRAMLKKYTVEMFVFCEKAHTFPGEGSVSSFNYGYHCGELAGLLFALNIPYELVPSTVWTKLMHAGVSGDRAKAKSLKAVQRLFPGADLKNPDVPRSRIFHDGLVDALLIAEWGRRKLLAVES